MIFQVTGLPRSGTAFMATLLNLHPHCFAHHDLAAERDDWRECSERLEQKWKFVGESSTYGWFPKATRSTGPKVFIDRDPSECTRSVAAILDHAVDVAAYRNSRVEALFWADQHKALVVPFEHLFTLPILARIWEHIFGADYTFPVEKAAIFSIMNIQRQNPKAAFGDATHVRERLFA